LEISKIVGNEEGKRAMIRRVAFKKAIFAGSLGAAAWELCARVVSVAGVPIFDIVQTLGVTLLGRDAPAWQWWAVGMAMHCIVGSIWAIFYAYFFWSTLDKPPVVQGVVFSLLPAVLAGLVMVPQIDLMQNNIRQTSGLFAITIGVGGPAMIVVGHIIYGVVLGSLYVRPVGYRVGQRVTIDA
jgi:hypothetical protein